jgi:hypothetical protein
VEISCREVRAKIVGRKILDAQTKWPKALQTAEIERRFQNVCQRLQSTAAATVP